MHFAYLTRKFSMMGSAPLSTRQLLVISTCVIVIHTICQLLEEAIFRYPGFNHGLFLTNVTFIANVIWNLVFASMKRYDLGGPMPSIARYRREKSLGTMVFVSFLFVGANALSKFALQFMNIPSQMIFKSMKIIPVMIGSMIVLRKQYTGLEYLIATIMVFGASLFTLGDAKHAPQFDPTGIVIISIALCFDALLGNVQERIMKQNIATLGDLMACQAWFGCVYTLVLAALSNQLISGIVLVSSHPDLLGLLILHAATNLTATALVLQLVHKFSAVTAVTVTLCRKLIGISLSFLVFPKVFTSLHATGIFLVIGAATAHSFRPQISTWIARLGQRNLDTGRYALFPPQHGHYDKYRQSKDDISIV